LGAERESLPNRLANLPPTISIVRGQIGGGEPPGKTTGERYMERFELSIGITLCKPSQAKSAASGTLWVLRNSVTT
jgi:hypothetical protein